MAVRTVVIFSPAIGGVLLAIIPFMAGDAIRRRECPVNGVAAASVAVIACQILAVIRVPGATMNVIGWRPGAGGMTQVAGRCGSNVAVVLAGCRCAVMTTGTLAGLGFVVIKLRWQPGRSAMAYVTGAASDNVVCVFARCRHAVVTTVAGTGSQRRVIDSCGLPGTSGVAIITTARGQHMTAVLTSCRHAIVATVALARCNIVVTERRGQPAIDTMTTVT